MQRGFADYNGLDADGCEGEVLPAWSCGDDVVFDNHAYATVSIDGQCWFAKTSAAPLTPMATPFLVASVTRVGRQPRTGPARRLGKAPASATAQHQVETRNEAFSLSAYGRLYNWHAVNDARGLCPIGWHIPSDGEWTTLTDGLGGSLVAGNVLKSSQEWFLNGGGSAPNDFDAFPGGQRMNAGNFQGAGTDAFFWTSTALSSVQVWFRSMTWNSAQVVRNPAEKNVGMSIRCLKNNE